MVNSPLLPHDQRNLRLMIVLSFIGFLWFALFAKTFYAQVVRSGYYSEKLKNQSEKRVMLTPSRGRIYDRSGNVLADNYDGKKRENPQAANGFRIYPYGSLASQVVGCVGWNGRGIAGVEYSLDQELYGFEGWSFRKVDAHRRTYHGYDLEGQDPISGMDVVLTLDVDVQDAVEETLENHVEYLGAKAGSAIVMDPHTGEILAMANYPSYDPNIAQHSTQYLRNDAIQKTYEPGSTFKLFTASAALEEQQVNLEEKIDTEGGRLVIYGDVIRDTHDYGKVSFAEAMAHSSNVAFAKLATRVGSERFYRYARAFGFGMTTGVDLPAEEKGTLKELSRWSGRTLSTMAMGHEVSVTPLQLLTAAAAVANGGLLLRPRIVKELRSSEDGRIVKSFHPQVIRRVISPETAHKIKVVVKDVIEYGTASNLKSNLVSFSGKTGTAEKFDWDKGAYSKSKTNASFVGMIPAEDPQYVVIVVIDEPEKYTSGAKTAGPVFKEIAETLAVMPKAQSPKWLFSDPQLKVTLASHVQKRFVKAQLDSLYPYNPIKTQGKGSWIIHQWPLSGTELDKGDTLQLVLGNPAEELPDFRGLPLNSVLDLIENKGVTLKVNGSGRVARQFPVAGESWTKVSELTLELGEVM